MRRVGGFKFTQNAVSACSSSCNLFTDTLHAYVSQKLGKILFCFFQATSSLTIDESVITVL